MITKEDVSNAIENLKEENYQNAKVLPPAMYDILLKEYGKDFMKANNFVKSQLIK